MISAIFIGLLLSVGAVLASNEKIVVCYYGTWATYRWGAGKFDVEDVNVDLCTHLVYTFVGINSQGTVVSLDPYLDFSENSGKGNFKKFTDLKKKNPNLKTILAVGGYNEGSAKYSVMAANPAFRRNFVQSALKMVQDHNFDGFDVDWEYPNRRDTVYGRADVDNFTQLLKELREEFDKHGLLVTVAVVAVGEMASLSYDVAAISKYLDYISVMTYDMYGAWDPVTGHNAPLHKGEGDDAADANSLYTVDMSLKYWLEAGCPPEKLIIGIPLYGRTFTLANAHSSGVRAPAIGAGIAGLYTATSGFVGYNEMCYKLKTESWTVKTDEKAKVPYAFLNRDWVSYDDPASIAAKVEYALSLNLGGAMVWSIETDDFLGLCGEGDFPLLRSINKALAKTDSDSSSTVATSTASTPTEASSTSTALSTSTDAPSSTAEDSSSTAAASSSTTAEPTSTTTAAPQVTDALCKDVGYARNPSDCSSYYMCVEQVDGSLLPVKFLCPSSLHWDQKYNNCNYASLVDCKA